ncbi:MAG: hypothetical protein ABI840_07605, partial [bacterium]
FAKKLPSENSTNSFVISQNDDEDFKDRYDQISGSDITLNFLEDKMNTIEVNENSISIYFLYEENKANGVNKVEGKDLYIYFDNDEKVEKIKVDAEPKGEYIPEQLLSTSSLILPGFNLREDKPVRR